MGIPSSTPWRVAPGSTLKESRAQDRIYLGEGMTMSLQGLESQIEAVRQLAQAGVFVSATIWTVPGGWCGFRHDNGTGLAISFHQVMNHTTVALLHKIQVAFGVKVNAERIAMPQKPLARETPGIDFQLLYLQAAGFSRYEASHLRLLLWDVETGCSIPAAMSRRPVLPSATRGIDQWRPQAWVGGSSALGARRPPAVTCRVEGI
jgi:hypothetical protein